MSPCQAESTRLENARKMLQKFLEINWISNIFRIHSARLYQTRRDLPQYHLRRNLRKFQSWKQWQVQTVAQLAQKPKVRPKAKTPRDFQHKTLNEQLQDSFRSEVALRWNFEIPNPSSHIPNVKFRYFWDFRDWDFFSSGIPNP